MMIFVRKTVFYKIYYLNTPACSKGDHTIHDKSKGTQKAEKKKIEHRSTREQVFGQFSLKAKKKND